MTALPVFLAGYVLLAAPAAPDDTLHLSADESILDTGTKLLLAHGHVRMALRTLRLGAEHLYFDQKAGLGTSFDGVVILDGTSAAWAEEGALQTKPERLWLRNGTMFDKIGVGSADLLSARSRQEVEAVGTNKLTLRGDEFTRIGPKHYKILHLSFTPCRCKEENPEWSIDGNIADVEAGERAILQGAVLKVKGDPVIALPWLYVPLSDRRTGFLLPRVIIRNGLTVEEPFFLTLGVSHDLTLTAGWEGLLVSSDQPDTQAGTGFNGPRGGARGPRVSAEYRYAPAEGVDGKMRLVLIDDLNHDLDPSGMTPLLQSARGPRAVLTAVDKRDGTTFGERANLLLYSDGNLLIDNASVDIFTQAADYTRSTASVFARADRGLLWADISYYQDLRNLDGTPRPFFSTTTPQLVQRLPALSLLTALGTWGPIRTQLEGSVMSYTPLLRGPEVADPGLARPTALRLDLDPKLLVGQTFGTWLDLQAQVSFRGDAWLLNDTETDARGYPLLRLDASTAFQRVFEGTPRLRHLVEPRLSFLYVPTVLGSAPTPSYDEIDLPLGGACTSPAQSPGAETYTCAGPKRLAQGVASLATQLDVAGAAGKRTAVSAEIGQGYDFGMHRDADSYGRLNLDFGLARANGTIRYDAPTKRVVKASVDASAGPPDNVVYARYDHIDGGGSDLMRAGVDALFGQPLPPGAPLGYPALGSTLVSVPPGAPVSFDQIVVGASLSGPWRWILAHYEMVLRPPPNFGFIQHYASLGLRSACDCWRLDLTAIWLPRAGVTGIHELAPLMFTVNLNLALLGGASM